jgi:hypothetical protein
MSHLLLAALIVGSGWSTAAAKGGGGGTGGHGSTGGHSGSGASGGSHGSTSGSGGPKTVHVSGYTKKDGTYVAPYDRSAPRTAGREVPPVAYRTSPPSLSGVPTTPRTVARGQAALDTPLEASPPAASPATAEDDTPERKATYVKICKARADVEAAAVSKYGRKPRPDDNAGFKVPYLVFIEREEGKAMDALARKLGKLRPDLDRIRIEGDDKEWPKQ